GESDTQREREVGDTGGQLHHGPYQRIAGVDGVAGEAQDPAHQREQIGHHGWEAEVQTIGLAERGTADVADPANELVKIVSEAIRRQQNQPDEDGCREAGNDDGPGPRGAPGREGRAGANGHHYRPASGSGPSICGEPPLRTPRAVVLPAHAATGTRSTGTFSSE